MKTFLHSIANFFVRLLMKKWWLGIVLIALGLINACDTTSSVSPNQGQTFIKLFGGNGSEEGKDLIALPDGGFVMVGSTTSSSGTFIPNGEKDVYVVRTDNIGNVVWENSYGGTGDDVGNSVILGTNNSLYVCGEVTQDSSLIVGLRDMIVLNLNLDNGSLIGGEHYYGDTLKDEFGTSILETENGFLLTATHQTENSKFFMVETDRNLLALPNRSKYVTGDEGVNNLSATTFEKVSYSASDPPFICFGSVYEFNSLTYKFQSFEYNTNNQNAIFQELYGSNANDEYCTDADQLLDGGYILAGFAVVGGINNEMLVKIDPNRQLVGAPQIYSNEYNANVRDCGVYQTRDGGYIVSSTIELPDPDGGDEISLLRTNSEGEELWRNSYGSNENDIGAKVVELDDGSFVVVGTIGFDINPDSKSKMCLMKVNANGELVPL